MASKHSVHGFRAFNSINPTKPYIVSTNNTLVPAS